MPLTIDLCGYDKLDIAGGPIVWLQRISHALRSLGHNVRLRLLGWHEPEEGILFRQLRQEGFDVLGKRFTDTDSNVRWFLDQTLRSPPDLFVANLVTPAFYASRWIREAGIPTVGVLHSDDSFYHAIQQEFVVGNTANAVSAIVCVSRELEQQVLRQRPQRTIVARIPYGVPTPHVPLEKIIAKKSSSPLRIAYVGRLAEEQKRITEVARSFCRAVREVPGVEATIFGDGPEKETVEQILKVEGSGLPVVLAGNVPSQELQLRLLESYHVVVLLSDYEGLPISLLEAMACGVVPVCLSIRSGIPELIDDGVTGLLVDDRGGAFVNSIHRINADRDLWHRLSLAAREKVREANSIDASAKMWANLLTSLPDPRFPKRPVRIPKQLNLPPVNPVLIGEDRRLPHPRRNLIGKSRMKLGAIKRYIVGGIEQQDREAHGGM